MGNRSEECSDISTTVECDSHEVGLPSYGFCRLVSRFLGKRAVRYFFTTHMAQQC